ncbi:hypothetical protein PV327_007793 [Microctonus hyperodae]|uniref:Uncharacterized protein n=1 Tax=Microctonus hyperodae TaxID=165561 RepID=A0AA39FZY7_MICHY|nr:hypothetical protein PV327_007793 [Microctonus hyperodae]
MEVNNDKQSSLTQSELNVTLDEIDLTKHSNENTSKIEEDDSSTCRSKRNIIVAPKSETCRRDSKGRWRRVL